MLIGAMATKLLTVDEAATRLGLDRQDVLAMIRARRLHGIVVDGVLRVAEQDVEFLVSPPHVSTVNFADHEIDPENLPKVTLSDYDIASEIVALIPKDVALRLRVMPVQRAGSSLIVAMADPTDLAAVDEIKLLTALNVEPVVATEADIVEAIERSYGG